MRHLTSGTSPVPCGMATRSPRGRCPSTVRVSRGSITPSYGSVARSRTGQLNRKPGPASAQAGGSSAQHQGDPVGLGQRPQQQRRAVRPGCRPGWPAPAPAGPPLPASRTSSTPLSATSGSIAGASCASTATRCPCTAPNPASERAAPMRPELVEVGAVEHPGQHLAQVGHRGRAALATASSSSASYRGGSTAPVLRPALERDQAGAPSGAPGAARPARPRRPCRIRAASPCPRTVIAWSARSAAGPAGVERAEDGAQHRRGHPPEPCKQGSGTPGGRAPPASTPAAAPAAAGAGRRARRPASNLRRPAPGRPASRTVGSLRDDHALGAARSRRSR